MNHPSIREQSRGKRGDVIIVISSHVDELLGQHCLGLGANCA